MGCFIIFTTFDIEGSRAMTFAHGYAEGVCSAVYIEI